MASKLGGLVVVAALAAGGAYYLHASDPTRKAESRTHEVIEAAHKAEPEAGLRSLDAVMKTDDWGRVADSTKASVGAEIVRLSAEYVKTPFTRAKVDEATRVVTRYRALPPPAQGGVARDAMMTILGGWEEALSTPGDREAKIAILRLELSAADGSRTAEIGQRLATARLEMARAVEADWPLDALGFLAEEPRAPEGVAEAGKILARLADQPSLLVDAGTDVDAWLASTPKTDPLREKIEAQRTLGQKTKETDDSADATAKAEPWDQWVVVRQANADVSAGKLDAAEARLRKIGPPGMMIRDATFVLGRIALAQGKLDVADQLFSGLLGSRLQGFLTANAALETAVTRVREHIDVSLKTGSLPPDVLRKLQGASEADQRAIAQGWVSDVMNNDPDIQKGRTAMQQYEEVVPASILAGTVKLRRAQALSGADKEQMLAAAERTFLAVRTAAEGQPEFHLGLGEIYARLGKTAESDAELKGLLDKKDPMLTFRVAQLYRNIGSVQRAMEIAKQAYDAPGSDKEIKEASAVLVALMSTTDEEREAWYRKGDVESSHVRTALDEIEGRRFLREGKRAECDKKFAESAKLSLAEASATNQAAYNNAALANSQRFACTGDVEVLREAEKTLETAYRVASDSPIVVANLAGLLQSNVDVRVLAKRIDVRVLRLAGNDAESLVDALLDGTERTALLAELLADPGWRRSAELYAQYEVLAPSSTLSYSEDLSRARRVLDPAMATGALERLRAAKRLDTSQAEQALARYLKGDADKEMLDDVNGSLARLTEVLAGKTDPHTRSAALFLEAGMLQQHSVLANNPGDIITAREARIQAAKLWPALASEPSVGHSLIDEAGFAADAVRWAKLRRERGAAATVAKLAADDDPLAAKIRGSSQWREIAAHFKGVTGTPDVEDLQLARMLGDAAFLAWANAATEDKVLRAGIEARKLLVPTDTRAAEQLAVLTTR